MAVLSKSGKKRNGVGYLIVVLAVLDIVAGPVLHRKNDSKISFFDTQKNRNVAGYVLGLLISICAGLTIVLQILNLQSRRVLDRDGLSWSFSLLFGPRFWNGRSTQGWSVLDEPSPTLPGSFGIREILLAHVRVDVAFIVAYALLGAVVIAAIFRGRGRWLPTVPLIVLTVADLTEDALGLSIVGPGRSSVIDWLPICTAVKWIALLVLSLLLVLRLATQGERNRSVASRSTVKRALGGLRHHRLSLLPSIAMFVLTVTSGSAVLEQLPDAQRGWVDDGWFSGQGFAAVLATGVVTALVFVTTRVRNDFALFCQEVKAGAETPTPRNARLRHWLIGPGVAVGAAAAACLIGRTHAVGNASGSNSFGAIHLFRFIGFLAVPVLVIVVSRVLRAMWWSTENEAEFVRDHPGFWRRLGRTWRRSGRSGRSVQYLPPLLAPDANAYAMVGNIATASVAVIGGLGLIRAFTPLLVLRADLELAEVSKHISFGGATVWIVTGAIAVAAPWLILILSTYTGFSPLSQKLGAVRTGKVVIAASVGVFLVVGVFPGWVGRLGLAAVAQLSIGALTGMMAGLGLLIQNRPPAEVFSVVGLRRTPLVTVLVVTIVLVNAFSGSGSIHRIDPGVPVDQHRPADDLPKRTTLTEAFKAWADDPNGCEVKVGGGHSVRPMLLIAAEGGGIRAAYWTVRSLQALGQNNCANHAAFFSSGASGGSVGLTVARFSGTTQDPDLSAAVRAVDQMARPRTLSEAADGMFVRDVFYGATGIPVPRIGVAGRDWAWADRARLIEAGWKAAHDPSGRSWGTQPFLRTGNLSTATGQLILNTTSVHSNCRVWISQVQIDNPAVGATSRSSFDPELSCDRMPGPGPRTIDLFTAYGPYDGADGDRSSCLGDPSAATVALLTARFPYVTPGAVVGPCPDRGKVSGKTESFWPTTQLVDGGYIENTGLATITDLAPQWMPMVRARNIEAAKPGSHTAFVVPIVVYLSNGDPASTQPKVDTGPTSELSLPIVTLNAAGDALSDADALLERARAVIGLDNFCPYMELSDLAPACRDLDAAFLRRVVVVDRLTRPEISAPLGWTLSKASRGALDRAVDIQFTATCDGAGPPSCQHGYAPLGELRKYFAHASS